MDESIAYQWAWECLKPLSGQNVEQHKIEQAVDKIAQALLAADRGELYSIMPA